MNNPLTPAGIELATFRFVAQHLNHCVTAVPNSELDQSKILRCHLAYHRNRPAIQYPQKSCQNYETLHRILILHRSLSSSRDS